MNKSELIYKRIVAKFGTSLLTGGSDHLDLKVMAGLVRQLAHLHNQGNELAVVTSGAVASGRDKLGLPGRMKGSSTKASFIFSWAKPFNV